MKVIFLKHVPAVARKYDVKEVADGYALNFLFPQKVAEMATEKGLARLEQLKADQQKEEGVQAELLAKNLESLSRVTIEFTKKANEQGHLFDSIHKEELSLELMNQARLNVPANFIELPKPLKETGEHEVRVSVAGKTVTFKVIINTL
jgi:large subunit ribosomal protein L9